MSRFLTMPGRALPVLESSIWNVLALFFCVDDVHCCETLFACFGRQSACVLTIPRSSNPLAGVLFCLREGHYLRAEKLCRKPQFTSGNLVHFAR